MTKKHFLTRITASAVSVCMMLHFYPRVSITADYSIPSMPDFSYMGAVGNLTAEQTKTAAEAVYGALYMHENEANFAACGISMTSDNTSDLVSVFRHVSACYDVGILMKKGPISYSPKKSTITISYIYDGSEYEEKYLEYTSIMDGILSGVDENWSDEEKALYLHDYLCVKYDYDYPWLYGAAVREGKEPYSAFGLIKNGLSVCEGYSELYAKLMNKLGIHTQIVTSDTLGHAWNLVTISGNNYFVDVAWDDSYKEYKGSVGHYNFLKTSEELIEANHDATDWKDVYGNSVYDLAVPDTFSNAFWNFTDKAIKPYGNGWLTVTGSFNNVNIELLVYDPATHSAAASDFMDTIPSSESTWFIWDNPGAYWEEIFTVIDTANDILYYTAPTSIYAYNNGKSVKVYELNNEEKSKGYIYGMYCEGDTLYYGLDTERFFVDEMGDVPIEYYSLKLSDIENTVIAETGEPASRTTPPDESTTTTTESTTTTSETTTTTATKTTTVSSSVTTVTTAPPPTEPQTGDIDGNGLIDAVDASKLLSYYAKISTDPSFNVTDELKLIADVDKNGTIDAVDASKLLSYYAYLSTHTETLSLNDFLSK